MINEKQGNKYKPFPGTIQGQSQEPIFPGMIQEQSQEPIILIDAGEDDQVNNVSLRHLKHHYQKISAKNYFSIIMHSENFPNLYRPSYFTKMQPNKLTEKRKLYLRQLKKFKEQVKRDSFEQHRNYYQEGCKLLERDKEALLEEYELSDLEYLNFDLFVNESQEIQKYWLELEGVRHYNFKEPHTLAKGIKEYEPPSLELKLAHLEELAGLAPSELEPLNKILPPELALRPTDNRMLEYSIAERNHFKPTLNPEDWASSLSIRNKFQIKFRIFQAMKAAKFNYHINSEIYNSIVEEMELYVDADLKFPLTEDKFKRESTLLAELYNAIKNNQNNFPEEMKPFLVRVLQFIYEETSGYLDDKPKEEEIIKEPADLNETTYSLGELDFEKANNLLFTHEPCIPDVRQGWLLNSAMLAGLTSIVADSPQTIKEHMKDEGKTVLVKFFKRCDNSTCNGYEPQYFRVKKLIPKDNKDKDFFARGALWVQMLERAYTSYLMYNYNNGKKGYKILEDKNAAKIEKYYKFDFINALLGKGYRPEVIDLEEINHDMKQDKDEFNAGPKSVLLSVKNSITESRSEHFAQHFEADATSDVKKYLLSLPDLLYYEVTKNYVDRALTDSAEILEQPDVMLTVWKTHVINELTKYIDNSISNCNDETNAFAPGHKISNAKRFSSRLSGIIQHQPTDLFQNLSSFYNLTIDYVKDIFSAITSSYQQTLLDNDHSTSFFEHTEPRPIPNKDNIYTAQEYLLYQRIKSALCERNLLRAEAEESIEETFIRPSKLNADKHTFTVLGAETQDGPKGIRKFIRLRNPYGQEKDYKPTAKKLEPHEIELYTGENSDGIFLFELKEFTTYFKKITYN